MTQIKIKVSAPKGAHYVPLILPEDLDSFGGIKIEYATDSDSSQEGIV